jgi:hypothetical protein
VRLRAAVPIAKNPRIIIAQVLGSGTGETGSTGTVGSVGVAGGVVAPGPPAIGVAGLGRNDEPGGDGTIDGGATLGPGANPEAGVPGVPRNESLVGPSADGVRLGAPGAAIPGTPSLVPPAPAGRGRGGLPIVYCPPPPCGE